ncbi:hypothetical protein N7U66_17765 [Lacinutrix neustonica]|uniref:Uncharacterized protein n=1 Tax=Lacinutrix neustonica TaxID=2980107 RepID=A0A9E8MWT8_9FLAO|nr:hypothetical protein [Lacinutrix neustonica]WAC01724.1 hypothetical protein N7U66_17765 [Lacinutrix neustonica]
MAYTFNMENTLNEEVIVKWYDWNDDTHGISAANYNISANGHKSIDAKNNVVIQISVFKANNNPLLDGKSMNFYATKRNMKIVENNGVTSIAYTD